MQGRGRAFERILRKNWYLLSAPCAPQLLWSLRASFFDANHPQGSTVANLMLQNRTENVKCEGVDCARSARVRRTLGKLRAVENRPRGGRIAAVASAIFPGRVALSLGGNLHQLGY